MKPTRFRRQALVLFFAVSLMPALTVSALWYAYTRDAGGASLFASGWLIAPIAVIGLLPAIILALLFAELLAQPIRKLHHGIIRISQGHLEQRLDFRGGEFAEMAVALNSIAQTMQLVLSQTEGETEVIAAERNKLGAVLDSMTDGVFALDVSGRIILFNRAAASLSGQSLNAVAGQPASRVLPLRHDGRSIYAALPAQGLKRFKGAQLGNSETDSRVVDVQAVGLSGDPNGLRALITFHDVTASRQLEAMKVDFVSMAAHQLRTPLTAIKGYLELLENEAASGLSPVHRSFLYRTQLKADQLTVLVNNLLLASKIEDGQLSIQPRPTDWRQFMQKLEPRLRGLADDAGGRLELDLPASLPQVKVDAGALGEVITNLVANAVRHSPPLQPVSVSTHRRGDDIETVITDRGPGIAKLDQTKLFTKFYHVPGQESGGPGLGLYIAKAVIEAHGGHIWVESDPGRATVFGFRLPLDAVAVGETPSHNKMTDLKGAHGWIKTHPIRRG